MASYFRNLFGGNNTSTSRPRSTSKPVPPPKGHAHPTTPASSPGPNAIYATLPGTAASAGSMSSRNKLGRASSYTTTPTMKPSPLRYDSRRSFDNARPDTAASHNGTPIYRTTSRNPHEGRYPHHASSGYATSSSSRSNSSSSLYPGSLHAHQYSHSVPSPLAPSSHASVKAAHADRRPQLKQNHTCTLA